jgi:hypothetical protein
VVAPLAVLVLMGACSAWHDTSPPPTPQVSFRRDIEPVLAKHCTSSSCHGDEPTIDVALDLRPSVAYGQLVNVPAEMGEEHLPRIKPGDPQHSMIVLKLTGRLGVKDGKRMPIKDDTGEPVVPAPLPREFIEGVLVPWIAAGAPEHVAAN